MKQILLSATLLFISLGLSAQSNFKPGYYINAKNDTVKGLIDQREKFYNPKTFYFKATPGATIQNITPANANAVGITGYNYYEKHITTISNGSTSLNQLSNRPDTTFVTDTVFLRIIKKGRNVSLYAYTDGIKTRYYILEDIDNKAVELKYSAFLSDETRNVVDVNIFRQQLQILAQKYQPNSPNLVNRINTAVYDESPLSQITSLLNGGNDNSKYEVKSLETSRFFIGAGVKNRQLYTKLTK